MFTAKRQRVETEIETAKKVGGEMKNGYKREEKINEEYTMHNEE